jgi:hypothetical protein
MRALRVRHLFVAGLAIGAVALLPASAGAHPEACVETGLFSSSPSADWYADWTAENEGCMSAAVVASFDDSDAELAAGEQAGTDNLTLTSSTPKKKPFETETDFNSDIAFENGYAFTGNYDGVQIYDVRDGQTPALASIIECPGSQNDVTVNDGILVTSTDSRRTDDSCTSAPATDASLPTTWEGLKIFDVRNPYKPVHLASVRTDCGSHTHTALPERDRVIIYVQSYDIGTGRYECEQGADPTKAHDKISIVSIPKRNPANARVVAEPVLFPDGGNDGTAGTIRTNGTTGCHDITVYQEKGLAAGACTGEGVIFDIRNPVRPKVLATVEDTNFAFWHSATFSNDGKRVLFTDELGGGSAATCNPTIGQRKGADAIYDISDPANPRFLSYFKIPRTQNNSENCVAHNGNLIPNKKGRDIMIQSWYQGGVSVIDWTKPKKVKEIAWFDRGPYGSTVPPAPLAGFWSSYYYNGYIYGTEIQRGFDVFELDDPAIKGAEKFEYDTLNAQTQSRF